MKNRILLVTGFSIGVSLATGFFIGKVVAYNSIKTMLNMLDNEKIEVAYSRGYIDCMTGISMEKGSDKFVNTLKTIKNGN